jgi:hypothetical protein
VHKILVLLARRPKAAVGTSSLALFLILAALALGASTTDAATPPQFVIDDTKHDFGDVIAGEELTRIFTVRNTGGETLKLSNAPLMAGLSGPPARGLIRAIAALDYGQSSPGRFAMAAAASRRAAPS